MNVSLRWLREFVDLPTEDPAELESVLSNLGLEVEGVEVIESRFTGVVVARVLEVKPHPNADKLRLVRVDRGDGEQEVVCGAWNFEAGAIVPLADGDRSCLMSSTGGNLIVDLNGWWMP